jgi:hypothetical protein
MSDLTTLNRIADIATSYFMPMLLKSEDFDSFESNVVEESRELGAICLKSCLEAFDKALRAHLPKDWSLHDVCQRTIITLLGAVSYRRSVYTDEFGNRRIWLDEILGIPKRARLSAGAFLWVVRQASEKSYRKTALAFNQLTGEKISHVCVMDCVHTEGELLKNAPIESFDTKISQDEIFTEVDGLWIHLQSPKHRKHALPRFFYEQVRKTTSFELKMACIYAGKRKIAPARYERGNLKIVVGDDKPDVFWQRIAKQIEADYEVCDLEHIWVGHDGAEWCSAERLAQAFANTNVIGSLDPFHVMKYIVKAFPEGKKRDWAIYLACKGKGNQLAKMSKRIADKMKSGSAKDKVEQLAKYVKNNATDIHFPTSSMGTMEATNYHIGAARCKNNATSWSRRGAEAMCLIRAAIQTGHSLIVPDKGVLLTTKEKKKKQEILSAFTSSAIPAVVGSGYEMPFSHVVTPKKATISVARRS